MIAGYYGFQNAGDEFILKSLIRTLTQKYPDCDITVLSNLVESTKKEHSVRAVYRWNPFMVLYAIMSCDTLLFGGGGLLQDSTGIKSLWYYLSLLWTGLLLNKRIIVESIGVGPLIRPFSRFLVRITFNWIDSISVRDYFSVRELNRIKINRLPTLKGDPVLMLGDLNRAKKGNTHQLPVIGLIPRWPVIESTRQTDHPNFYTNLKWLEDTLQACKQLANEIQGQIKILPFHPPQDQKWIKEIPLEQTSILQWNTLEELLLHIENMHLVVSMRYHGAMIASLLNIPVFGIAVDSKIEQFFDDCNAPNHLIQFNQKNVLSNEMIYNKLSGFWRNRLIATEHITKQIQEIKRRIQAN